jgi:tRNA-dihydrouridine synthase B
MRHARKHLGWALDAAAQAVGCAATLLKACRERVLTCDEPSAVRRHLADAYAAFFDSARKAA